MQKKSLITGGAGVVGYFLARRLADQGQSVTIADNLSFGKIDDAMKEVLAMPNVDFIELDVTDEKQFINLKSGYDYVYHLAAINGTRHFYEIPEKVLRVGLLGVINILEWFKNQDKGKVLFTSTNETYASYINLTGGPLPTPENVPLCVDDITNPRWSYGGSKLAGELLFMNYARIYKFPMTITRYHNSYGPRMGKEHVIPTFLMRIINKEDPFKIFGGKETRTFCYIDDTVRATQLVMENDNTSGEIINIGNDNEEIAMSDLAQKMFKLFNYQPKELEIHDAPEGSVKRRCPDLSKIKQLTGYKPEVSLEQGLKKTYDWYKNNFQ